MNRYESSRESWFGNRWRRISWLLPLVIGIGIGVLLFGLLPGFRWGIGGHTWASHGTGAYAPGYREQPAPRTEAVPPGPQERFHHGRGPGRGHYAHTTRERGGAFFPFAGSRLIVPLLLIGAGAWLLARPRHGGGGSGGPAERGPYSSQPGTDPTPFTPAAGLEPGSTPEPPATGETRRL